MKYLFTLLALVIATFSVSAQEFSLGFKTGLNYSTIDFDSEINADGKELETTNFNSGFQIGVIVDYSLTDEFGLRGEFLFSQKGAKYKYEGMGTRVYPTLTGAKTATGFMKETYGINNGYIEIPLMAYYKVGKFELSGGVSFGLIVTSKASGERTFDGVTKGGTVLPQYTRTISYNYLNNGVLTNEATLELIIDGESIILAKDEIRDPTINGKLYNVFEMAGIVGLSYYFNQSLFLNLRAQYGLTDVTNNEFHIQKQIDQDVVYDDLLRNTKDININLSATIGFSF